MTNRMIILMNSARLMEDGVIGTTGRSITVQDKDGTERVLMEPEEIHTFAGWKARGFSVKKGEHAVASFPIWTGGKVRSEDDEEDEKSESRMFLRKAFWFTAAQVESSEDREARLAAKKARKVAVVPAAPASYGSWLS